MIFQLTDTPRKEADREQREWQEALNKGGATTPASALVG